MQTKYFRLAKQIALRSDHRVKIGAVLVNKGQVLNVGHNRVGHTHPKYPWYLHAEMDVCLGIHRHDLTGATIYLFRSNRVGNVLNCRPCSTCQSLLVELGIRRAVYTTGSELVDGEPHYLEMRL